MVDSYEQAINWIHERLKFGMKPGLERMEWMLERLDHPERRLKSVHIAGTNGKGSTLNFIRHIYQEEGLVVGTFTSPYIESFNERISVNGEGISDEQLVEIVQKVKPVVEEVEQTDLGAPTEFEVVTLIAIVYFATVAYPDLVLFETGLGGRLDSTNVIHPMISVITNIGHDHMNVLGESIEQVAKEKAGIIKSGVPVISGVEQEEALNVIKDEIKSKWSKLYQYGNQFDTENHEMLDDGEAFTFTSLFTKKEHLQISMKGTHQVKNAALALMTVDYLQRFYSLVVEDESIEKGLKKANWPGRFEQVMDKPKVIVDGAHNPEGIEQLVKTIENRYSDNYNVRIIFSALEDKNIKEMVNPLSQVAFRMTFTTFDFPRAMNAKELFEACTFTNKHYREDWKEALQEEMDSMSENEVLIVCGSLYFVSEVRNKLRNTKI